MLKSFAFGGIILLTFDVSHAQQASIDAASARSRVGEVVTVCDRVTSLSCRQQNGQPNDPNYSLTLVLGDQNPLRVPILKSALPITDSVGGRFSGQIACVTGKIEDTTTGVQIIATEFGSIVVPDGQTSRVPKDVYGGCDPGVVMPVIVRGPAPRRPPKGNLAIRGSVVLQGVVGVDGRVSDMRVIRSLAADFDAEAIRTFQQQWEFKPATRMGKPVKYIVQGDLPFN